MKKILLALAIAVPLLIGCSDSIISPEFQDKENNNQASWITLPKNPGMSIEEEYSASEVINGNEGGEVKLNIDYKTETGIHLKINTKIKVPKGAYDGDKNITMIINSNNGTATFYPSPESFNQPLKFDLEIEGIDLSGYNPKSLDFVYLAPDSSFEAVECHKIEVKVDKGKLKVDDALIPHFSVYGWCRRR